MSEQNVWASTALLYFDVVCPGNSMMADEAALCSSGCPSRIWEVEAIHWQHPQGWGSNLPSKGIWETQVHVSHSDFPVGGELRREAEKRKGEKRASLGSGWGGVRGSNIVLVLWEYLAKDREVQVAQHSGRRGPFSQRLVQTMPREIDLQRPTTVTVPPAVLDCMGMVY